MKGVITALLVLGAPGLSAAVETTWRDSASRVQDDEAGIKKISGLLKAFYSKLRTKKFEEAKDYYVQLQSAIKKADDVTRSHPEFGDMANRVSEAGIALEDGIEADRINRKNSAIDGIIKRANDALRRAQTYVGGISSRVPDTEDINGIAGVLSELQGIEREGANFAADDRYEPYAKDLGVKISGLAGRLRQAKWQRRASSVLSKMVAEASGHVETFKRAKSVPEQLAALERSATAFQACVAASGKLGRDSDAASNLLIKTKFGTLTFEDTQGRCLAALETTKKNVARKGWHDQVQAVVDPLNTAMKKLEAATTSKALYEASKAAETQLTACESQLAKLNQLPGFDPAVTFKSNLGTLSSSFLQKTCGKQKVRVQKLKPKYAWRIEAEDFGTRIDTLLGRVAEAESTEDPGKRVALWTSAEAAYGACGEGAQKLMGTAGAERTFTVDTRKGGMTVSNIRKLCTTGVKQAQKELAKAKGDQELKAFIGKCRGDEVSLARKKGIPDDIEKFDGGRVFIYKAGKGREGQRFDFDKAGKRTNFSNEWKRDMQAMVSAVSKTQKAQSKAKTASDLTTATKAFLPALEECSELIDSTKLSPGFDPKRKFNSPFGNLAAPQLAKACSKEHRKMEKELPKYSWRIGFERLRDNVAEAAKNAKEGKRSKKADGKISAYRKAIAQFEACAEHTKTGAGKEDADLRFEMKTALGTATVRKLGSLCKKELKPLKAELKDAEDLKKLEEFLPSTRADETKTAKKLGVPDDVEELGEGRVFVYKGRGKANRVAFDGRGKKTSEKALKKKIKQAEKAKEKAQKKAEKQANKGSQGKK